MLNIIKLRKEISFPIVEGGIILKKHFNLVLVLVLAVSLLFSACGKQNGSDVAGTDTNTSSPAPQNDNKPKEKVEIKLSTWAGSEEAAELQAILDKLNAASDTYIIVQDSNPADYDTRLTTQLSGNAGPDLFWVSAARGAQFAARGVMMDITDRMKSSNKPAANLDDYYEASFDPFKKDGKIYAIPWIMQPVVLYVNQDALDKAGVTIDDNWNWDAFMDAAKKLTLDKNGKHLGESGFDANNVVQWGFTLNGWPPVQMFIWQAGGEVIAPDFSSSPIDTPEAMKGFKFYRELLDSGVVPSQQTIRDRGFDQMFRDGQVAMFMGGAADSLDTRVDSFKCVVREVPAGPTGIKATFVDLLGMGINAKTKNPDAAFEALVDLSEEIHKWKVMPPRKSIGSLDNMVTLHPERKDAFAAIVNSLEYAKPYRFYQDYPDWDTIFWNQLMDPIVNNNGKPEELVPNIKPLLDEALK
ncbi:MAG: sugar ABC transporter substrate-binding protein [Clostridiaceae bacterium]|nr:sugar ABC transporter substrate-binding protein [Clostridiaceae bacterium]